MKYLVPLIFLSGFFFSNAQHQDKVDFIRGEVSIEPLTSTKQIKGAVTYWFKVLQDVDSVFLDAKNMKFEMSYLNGKEVGVNNTGETISIHNVFKKGESYKLELFYLASPKQTVYFLGWEDDISENDQIWTQGQGKYTSHWLPSFDDMLEKVEFDLTIAAKNGLTVIANGEYVYTSTTRGGNIDEWHFDMLDPMSSYLLAFAIGNYDKQELKSNSGIPIENYYYPKDSLKAEPTYRYTKEIFDFLETEIDVPYPWQNYKQIPVRDFLYAGMENTTATIFSDGYIIDSTAFADKNYTNVNAHELAHQWFGNLVTEKSGNHHWLHEGFATYYAQLAEKEIFGDDKYYWKLYDALMQLQSAVDRGEGQSLIDPKASSLVFYEKGAWALYMLRNQIGDDEFRKGIKAYLEKYQFKNVTISDFLKEMETASGTDLLEFKRDWLENEALPLETAKKQLQKDSESLHILFVMEAELEKKQNTIIDYDMYWNKSNSVHFRKHILNTYYEVLPGSLLLNAFDSDSVLIRQVLARKMDSIPKELKTKFESLLTDASYVTIENALFKLWVTYPSEKAKYLEITKNIQGLPNKNVRLLWLTLAILTNDYDGRNTQNYFKELSHYTSPQYGWEIQKGAFQYLNQAIGLDDASLKNLVIATSHHSWQFKKFARNLVDELLKDEDYKIRFLEICKELKGEKFRYMNTKLDQE